MAEVLEAQQNNDLSGWRIAGLVRSEAQAAKNRSLSPVEPIVVSDFDELDKLEEIAQGFDGKKRWMLLSLFGFFDADPRGWAVIIHAGAGWHTASARAFLRGLAIGKRNRAGHRHPHYIQVFSRTSFSASVQRDGQTIRITFPLA